MTATIVPLVESFSVTLSSDLVEKLRRSEAAQVLLKQAIELVSLALWIDPEAVWPLLQPRRGLRYMEDLCYAHTPWRSDANKADAFDLRGFRAHELVPTLTIEFPCGDCEKGRERYEVSGRMLVSTASPDHQVASEAAKRMLLTRDLSCQWQQCPVPIRLRATRADSVSEQPGAVTGTNDGVLLEAMVEMLESTRGERESQNVFEIIEMDLWSFALDDRMPAALSGLRKSDIPIRQFATKIEDDHGFSECVDALMQPVLTASGNHSPRVRDISVLVSLCGDSLEPMVPLVSLFKRAEPLQQLQLLIPD